LAFNFADSFNGLTWAAGIGRIGEPTALGAREGRGLDMSYRSDDSNSQQSSRFQHFSKGDFDLEEER
jgi:hypothetical protein